MKIVESLFCLKDKEYASFKAKLLPTINCKKIIGVRVPELRKLTKKIFNEGDYDDYLKQLPHDYHEENLLEALLINEVKDYASCLNYLTAFLPFVDNWEVCDSIRPKVFNSYSPVLIKEIKKWLDSKHNYTLRFGIEMLMLHYLDQEFKVEYLDLVNNIKFDDYYVQMMQAWFFQTALVKQYEITIKYLNNKPLTKVVNKMTIQKCLDSYQLNKSQKIYLKTLRYND